MALGLLMAAAVAAGSGTVQAAVPSDGEPSAEVVSAALPPAGESGAGPSPGGGFPDHLPVPGLAVGGESLVRSMVGSATSEDIPEVPIPPDRPEARSFTLAFTGDLLLHQRVTAAAASAAAAIDDPGRHYDYRPLMEPIRPWIEGVDWAVCHMEVNLSADGQRLSPYPVFRAPGQIAFDAADLGYDACSTASNHTLDHGVDGVVETLGVLDDAGLRFTGSARSEAEAETSIWYDIGGVRLAHLSYAYWFNGFALPEGAPWTANEIDEERILADASRARTEGAEYVLVSLHWGEQYQNEPSTQQRDLGPRLLASPDIDLIIGHHAHVVQPIDRIDGEWLVYGLGNLLANGSRAIEADELLVTVSVTETGGGSGRFATDLEVVPLFIDRSVMVVRPSSPDQRPLGLTEATAAELDASWNRVLDVLRTGTAWPDLAERWPDRAEDPAGRIDDPAGGTGQ
jgi:poly-gamma-glutamate synthesis protein (capsule biosynthesis protein)